MTHDSELNSPVLQSDSEARAWLERVLWPSGPVCPHFGTLNEATLIDGEKHSHRDGLYMCNACRKQFTVTVGTIFERSHVPLHKWVQAALLIARVGGEFGANHLAVGKRYRQRRQVDLAVSAAGGTAAGRGASQHQK
jgi:transposase-like protein